MLEFIQANLTLILFGVFFVVMLRMHAGGAGCGMGHGEHQQATEPKEWPTAGDRKVSQNSAPNTEAPAERHTAGCH